MMEEIAEWKPAAKCPVCHRWLAMNDINSIYKQRIDDIKVQEKSYCNNCGSELNDTDWFEPYRGMRKSNGKERN